MKKSSAFTSSPALFLYWLVVCAFLMIADIGNNELDSWYGKVGLYLFVGGLGIVFVGGMIAMCVQMYLSWRKKRNSKKGL